MNQTQSATLIGRSRPTVQAVELCKLPLSNKLADDISKATGIDPSWLMAGDPQAPMRGLDSNLDYGLSDFELWQARENFSPRDKTPASSSDIHMRTQSEGEEFGKIIADILRGALEESPAKHAVAILKVYGALMKLENECGKPGTESLLPPKWADFSEKFKGILQRGLASKAASSQGADRQLEDPKLTPEGSEKVNS
jgi:hypothetical protein